MWKLEKMTAAMINSLWNKWAVQQIEHSMSVDSNNDEHKKKLITQKLSNPTTHVDMEKLLLKKCGKKRLKYAILYRIAFISTYSSYWLGKTVCSTAAYSTTLISLLIRLMKRWQIESDVLKSTEIGEIRAREKRENCPLQFISVAFVSRRCWYHSLCLKCW